MPVPTLPRDRQAEDFDPHAVNVDLHSHSVVSDGTLMPTEVVERAHARGVQWLALTDHDEVSGLPEAMSRAQELGMGFIPGVEISVTWANETVHILGLGINPDNEGLKLGLARTRGGRDLRAQEMSHELSKVGIVNAYQGALKYADNPDLISRAHFARYLVELGLCGCVAEVFGRYLVPGKPGYVPHYWARLSDAVSWVQQAGGVAVVAHPARYRLTPLERSAFFDEFVALGGAGIEVMTSAHSAQEVMEYARITRHYGLKASRGSDFHGPEASNTDLGSLPPLPDAVEPIWAQWGIG
jgi:predicted metal-dependent phosphoesterase TrpH